MWLFWLRVKTTVSSSGACMSTMLVRVKKKLELALAWHCSKDQITSLASTLSPLAKVASGLRWKVQVSWSSLVSQLSAMAPTRLEVSATALPFSSVVVAYFTRRS